MWTKLDDGYTEHPKVIAAGPLAMSLDVAGMVYCGRNLTDGYVPTRAARNLVSGYVEVLSIDDESEMAEVDAPAVIERLLAVGRWHDEKTVTHCAACREHWPDWTRGYYIHDYLDYNPSRAKVLAERAAARARRSGKRRPDDDRSSGEVQANVARMPHASGEHRANVIDPAPAPAPAPDASDSLSPTSHGIARANGEQAGEKEATQRLHPKTASLLRPLSGGAA